MELDSDKDEAPSPTAWFLTRKVGEEEVASSHASFKVVSSASWIRGTGFRKQREEKRQSGGTLLPLALRVVKDATGCSRIAGAQGTLGTVELSKGPWPHRTPVVQKHPCSSGQLRGFES